MSDTPRKPYAPPTLTVRTVGDLLDELDGIAVVLREKAQTIQIAVETVRLLEERRRELERRLTALESGS